MLAHMVHADAGAVKRESWSHVFVQNTEILVSIAPQKERRPTPVARMCVCHARRPDGLVTSSDAGRHAVTAPGGHKRSTAFHAPPHGVVVLAVVLGHGVCAAGDRAAQDHGCGDADDDGLTHGMHVSTMLLAA